MARTKKTTATLPATSAVSADQVFLTEAELLERWRNTIALKTLKNWRSQGKGPTFKRLGGPAGVVLYSLKDVEAFEETTPPAYG